MAKKEKPAKTGKAKTKKGGGKLLPLLLLVFVALCALSPGAGVILLAGMIPSLVALFTDRSPHKMQALSVAVLNAVGVAWVIWQLVAGHAGIDVALGMLAQPHNWAILWAGAGVGLLLTRAIPPVVSQLLVGLAEMKIQKLRANQKILKEQWSDEVGVSR